MAQSAKILFGILLMVETLIFMGCEGGGGVKGSKDTIENRNSKEDTNNNLSSNSSETTLSRTDDLKATQRNLEDSILNIGAKVFTINEKTGEVVGCPFLKLVGEVDYKYEKIKAENETQKVKAFLPKIEKVWNSLNPERDTNYHEEFPEGDVGSKLGGGIFSPDGNYFITSYAGHGGVTKKLFFFTKEGKLLRKYIFDEWTEATGEFNLDGTFYIVTDTSVGDYWIFTVDGILKKKGNMFSQFKGTSMSAGYCNISKTGKYIVLGSSETHILNNKNELIGKISAWKTFIDEENDKIYCIDYGFIKVYDIKQMKYIYKCNLTNITGTNVEKNTLLLFFKNSKDYYYEISK